MQIYHHRDFGSGEFNIWITIVPVGVHVSSTGERISKSLQNSAAFEAESFWDGSSCNGVLGSGVDDSLPWAQVDIDCSFRSSFVDLKWSTHRYVCIKKNSLSLSFSQLVLLNC